MEKLTGASWRFSSDFPNTDTQSRCVDFERSSEFLEGIRTIPGPSPIGQSNTRLSANANFFVRPVNEKRRFSQLISLRDFEFLFLFS